MATRIMRQPRRVALLGALTALAAILFVAWAADSAQVDSQTGMDAVHQELDPDCAVGTTTNSDRTTFASFEPIASPDVMHDSVTLSWSGGHKNDRAFFFWSKPGTSNPNYDLVEGKSECTISGLDPSTNYVISVIRVRTIGTMVTTDEQKIPVTTTSGTVPVVSITAASGATEGSPVTFTVSATPAPTGHHLAVTVKKTTTGDYGVKDGYVTLTIFSGQTSGTRTFHTHNDLLDEPDGTVTATLVAGNNYDLGAVTTATVIVADDDGPLVVSITTPSSEITEGSLVIFTVRATPAPTTDLTVSLNITTTGDYGVTDRSHTVTIAGGTSSAALTLSTTDDTADEPDGSVTATLVAGNNYDLGAVNTATIIVADDDGLPAVSISGGWNVTEGSTVTFTVNVIPALTANLAVSLKITTTGDYGVTDGKHTVTILSGASIATLSLQTTNDSLDEPNGSVTATLVDETAYDLRANKTATVKVADDDLPSTRGNTCGPKTKQQGPITLSSTPGETWCPVHVSYSNGRYPYNPPSFDHVMGFDGTLTYNVSVPSDSCPATVQIRGAPRTGWGAIPRASLASIVAGSVVPETRIGSDPLSLDLQFTGSGAACSAPQQVTIYGVKAYLDHLETRGNVKIRHTLTQRNGNPVTEAGPRLSIWMLNDGWIDLNVGIPFVDTNNRQMSSEVHSDFGRWRTTQNEVGTETVSYINNVGPPSLIGNTVNTRPVERFTPYNYIRAPLPSATEQWTEFCVYIHPREMPDINAAGEMLLPSMGYYRTPYRQITLVPYTHNVDVWWYPGRHSHTPDNGYRLPFEIQRYTSVVNPGGRCEPASSGGTWQTVYSGGPTADTAEAQTTWETGTKNSVVPFVIAPQDLGQYINVRIRGVYGVSDQSSTQGTRLTPAGVLFVKFNLQEVPSVRARVPIVLTFVDTSSD